MEDFLIYDIEIKLYSAIFWCIFTFGYFSVYMLTEYTHSKIRNLLEYNRGGLKNAPVIFGIDSDFVYNVEECPICLNGFVVPTRVSCGHAYCLGCLVTFLQYNLNTYAPSCPLCRQIIDEAKVLNNYNPLQITTAEKISLEKRLRKLIKELNTTFCLLAPWKTSNSIILYVFLFMYVCTGIAYVISYKIQE